MRSVVGHRLIFMYRDNAAYFKQISLIGRDSNALDVLSMDKNTPVYTDTAALSEVILYKNKRLLYNDAEIGLYPDRIEVKNGGQKVLEVPYAQAGTITVHRGSFLSS